jgi:hypothetical protein
MEKIGVPFKAIEYRVRGNSNVNNTSQNLSASAADEEPRIESERIRVRDLNNRTENSFNSCNEVSQ